MLHAAWHRLMPCPGAKGRAWTPKIQVEPMPHKIMLKPNATTIIVPPSSAGKAFGERPGVHRSARQHTDPPKNQVHCETTFVLDFPPAVPTPCNQQQHAYIPFAVTHTHCIRCASRLLVEKATHTSKKSQTSGAMLPALYTICRRYHHIMQKAMGLLASAWHAMVAAARCRAQEPPARR